MTFSFHNASEGIVLANSHRGYSLLYPENTLPAFEAARLAGTRCIELDVHLTKDNQLVVTHDHSIDRVSTGTGFVEQLTLAHLRQFDFGLKFSAEFAGTQMPVLEDILRWAIKYKMGLIVEIKQRRRHADFVTAFVNLINSIPEAIDHIQLLAFNHVILNQIKHKIPEIQLQVVTLARYNDLLSAVQASQASCVCCEYEFVHVDDLRRYKKAGLGVRLFLHTIKDGLYPLEQYAQRFGYPVENEIVCWLKEGLIDMLSHDDIDYLKKLIIKAGLNWG